MPPPDGLRSLWMTESVRLTEAHTGWLDDEQANREARAAAGSFGHRLQVRAWSLGQRDGLAGAQSAWRQGAAWAALALALLASVSGLGLAWAAFGDDAVAGREATINVYRALGALLGLNWVMLLIWLLGLVLAAVSGKRSAASLSGLGWPGRLWLWISARLSRDARAWQLGPALLAVLQRGRLLRWLAGLFSHGLWLLVLLVALGGVLLLLATRRYGFVWESTLLGDASFVALTQALGWLPAQLGFPRLEPGLIAASGQGLVADAAVRQQWALWLIGVVTVYGLLPRLLLLLACAWGWRRGVRRLQVDEDFPGHRLLRARLMPAGEVLGVSDAAPAALERHALAPGAVWGAGAQWSQEAVLFAVELGPDHEWPPALPEGVAGDVHDGGRLDSGGQRQRALDQLQRAPARRLLLVCDARHTPDRGTLRLLVDLARLAGESRVWLLPPPSGAPLDPGRWQSWQEALDSAGLSLADGVALAWLETGTQVPGTGSAA